MNIVDSTCWIEYLKNTLIGDAVAPVVENPSELIVPTITMYEVYKILAADKGSDYAMQVINYMLSGTVVDLDSNLSVLAAQISPQYKLPMADSIIYATATYHSAIVWTSDQHFKDLPNINYFPKTVVT